MISLFAGLGVVVPILTAVAGGLMRVNDSSKSFEDTLGELETAVSSYKSAMREAAAETTELNAKFGAVSSSIRPFLKDLKELEQIKALNKLSEQFDKLETNSASFFQRLGAATVGGAALQEELAEELGLTAKKYKQLNRLVNQLKEAETSKERIETAQDLRDLIKDSVGNVEDMTEEMRSFYRQLVETTIVAGELEGAGPSSDWMDGAIKGVNALYNAVIKVAGLVSGLGKPERPDKFKTRPKAAPPLIDEEAYAAGRPPATRPVARGEIDLTEGTVGDAGGGGASAIDAREKAKKAVDALISSYDEEYAKALKVKQATEAIAEAQRKGAIPENMKANDILQDYIASLNDAENPIKKLGQTLKDSLGNAFMSIVDGTKSAKDAFKDMARIVIKQAFEMLVIKPILDSLFGGGGGGFFSFLTNANGNAFNKGQQITAYANGGVVDKPTMFPMANGAGLMGEAGPEAIMPLKRGKNGKLGVQMEGGSQQPVVIHQNFNFSANGDESVKRIIAQEAPKIANLTQKQILDQRRRGGVVKATFG
jgi:uncharacterized coiled-coil protein SlyX